MRYSDIFLRALQAVIGKINYRKKVGGFLFIIFNNLLNLLIRKCDDLRDFPRRPDPSKDERFKSFFMLVLSRP
jgi:hypothetical protein